MDIKYFKEMLKRIFLAVFIVAALSCTAKHRVDPQIDGSYNLTPDPQQGVIAKDLVEFIENYHYKKVSVNDSLSSVIFDNFLKALDEGKNYLLASDIKDFEQYRRTLDDDLRKGDLSSMFRMFNVYRKRQDERIKYALTQLDKKFDFTGNEKYVYERSKMPWFSSTAAADELWSKRVEYELLNLKIAGSDEAKNVQTLKKRYESILSQAGQADSQDAFQMMMNAFTNSIDPHTNYFNPMNAQRFNEDMARSFEGIGARLQLENEVVKVEGIIPGGPAFKAGTLNVNDKIIGVAQGDAEFEDVIGWKIDNTVSRIKGKKGTTVRLKIIPAGMELSSAPKIISLVRDKIVMQDGLAKKTIKTITTGGKTYKIGVIDLPGFYSDFKAQQAGDPNYQSTTRDVRMILDTLKQQNVDAVLIDLRSNGGGSLQEAIDLTGLFIKTGPVVQVKDKRRVEVNTDNKPEIAWTGPLGVIIDRLSASASEIFAGAIQDYGRGIIMGSQTYGKGTVQSAIDMNRVISTADKLLLMTQKKQTPDGKPVKVSPSGTEPEFGQINLTMAKFYRINGSSTQHRGVIPDIQFPSIYPTDKIGESSEASALPWDTIASSKYVPVANLNNVKPLLISQHEKRMKESTEYKNLQEDIAQINKRESETAVTLNEAQLKKERTEQDARDLARENQRRTIRGLPPLKKGETTKTKDIADFIQDESLNVMGDLIQLSKTNQVTMTY
jgi:carboxyl-terminal processing protease